jgi:hypothetical protein
VHAACHRELRARNRRQPAPSPATPVGLA